MKSKKLRQYRAIEVYGSRSKIFVQHNGIRWGHGVRHDLCGIALRIIFMCVLIAVISGCSKSDVVTHEETSSPVSLLSEDAHDVSLEESNAPFTPVFSGWSSWAGGPEAVFPVCKLMDKSGKEVVCETGDIEKRTDSYGYPIWFCSYYGRHGSAIVDIFAEDGSWRHTLQGEHFGCYMDENGLLCVKPYSSYGFWSIDDGETADFDDGLTYVYKVGTNIILTGTHETAEQANSNRVGIWDSSNKTLTYEGREVKLPDYINYACYEIEVIVDDSNEIGRTIYWDGNIFAKSSSNGHQYLFDASGENVILEGICLDRVEDKVSHKIYYTAIGYDDQLRVYNQQGEYITDLEGRFVAACWDGVFWTASKDETEIRSMETYDYEIYSKAIGE